MLQAVADILPVPLKNISSIKKPHEVNLFLTYFYAVNPQNFLILATFI